MGKEATQKLNTIFAQFVKKFQSRCWICHAKYTPKKSFTLHHRYYLPDEKIYSDFPDRVSYYSYLLPFVLQNPKRFRLLCSKHHWLAENWARLKPQNFKRCYSIAKEINTRRFGVFKSSAKYK